MDFRGKVAENVLTISIRYYKCKYRIKILKKLINLYYSKYLKLKDSEIIYRYTHV